MRYPILLIPSYGADRGRGRGAGARGRLPCEVSSDAPPPAIHEAHSTPGSPPRFHRMQGPSASWKHPSWPSKTGLGEAGIGEEFRTPLRNLQGQTELSYQSSYCKKQRTICGTAQQTQKSLEVINHTARARVGVRYTRRRIVGASCCRPRPSQKSYPILPGWMGGQCLLRLGW